MTVFNTWEIEDSDYETFVQRIYSDGEYKLRVLMSDRTACYMQNVGTESNGGLYEKMDALCNGGSIKGWTDESGKPISILNATEIDFEDLSAVEWPEYFIAIPTPNGQRKLRLYCLSHEVWDDIEIQYPRLYDTLTTEDIMFCDMEPRIEEFSAEDMVGDVFIAVKFSNDETRIEYFTECEYYALCSIPDDMSDIQEDAIEFAIDHDYDMVALVRISYGQIIKLIKCPYIKDICEE